jgi:peptidoglycan/xylan/chitin deacetylase (PgdA/CDA1 family)
MKSTVFVLFLLGFLMCESSFGQPKIILKLDDMQAKHNQCPSIPVMEYLIQKQIKAGFGAIADRFDSTAYSVLHLYLMAKNSNGELLFEIWNHGLEHIRPEYKGSSYAYQKEHFERSTQIIKKYLGVQMYSFGSPYNATDSTTNAVIANCPHYKVFMFSRVIPKVHNGILYFTHRVNMENGTGNPEYDYFVANYNKFKGKYSDYMILQGHPNKWTPDKMIQFKKIIHFLISQGCEFVTPYGYYQLSHISSKAQ